MSENIDLKELMATKTDKSLLHNLVQAIWLDDSHTINAICWVVEQRARLEMVKGDSAKGTSE